MKVQVLLSAYNGENFLKEQIDSILAQRGVEVSLLIRDDGSSDQTSAIAKAYKNKIVCYREENIGVKESFFDLIKKAPYADFYAFSDQDDFWQPDKLKVACDMLKTTAQPALYFSNLLIADEKLNAISQTNIKFTPTLGSFMAQNPATGCTMVFNCPLLEVFKNLTEPQKMSMHDTFLIRLAAAIDAKIFFDTTPHILYRQHSSNLLGNRSLFKKLLHYADFFIKNKSFSRPKEAALLIKTAGASLTPESLALLTQIVAYKFSYKTKLNLLKNKTLKTPSPFTNLITYLAIITNRF